MLGLPQTWMLEMGKQSGEFFEKTQDEFGRKTYRLKSLEQYSREHNTKEQPSKKYFSASTLEEIIRSYPMPRKNMKQTEIERGTMTPRPTLRLLSNHYHCRAEQPGCFHRLRAWPVDDQPSGTVVTPAGQAAPIHHPAEIHWTFRATDEPQILISQQDRCPWCPATAAGRGRQQAEGGAGSTSPNGILDANEPVPRPDACTAPANVQWDVSAGCTTSIPYATARLWSSDGSFARSDASVTVRPVAEPLRTGHNKGWPPTCVHHGPPRRRDSTDDSAGCQPP